LTPNGAAEADTVGDRGRLLRQVLLEVAGVRITEAQAVAVARVLSSR
jgi:Mn-dependent DtxR family transcriptional regulator